MSSKFIILFFLCTLAAAQGPPYPYTVTLTWVPSSSAGVTTQNVTRAVYAGSCGTFVVIASGLAPTVNSFVDGSPVPNSVYCYEVEAIATDGTATSQPVANVQIPPAPPTGITVSIVAPSQVQAAVNKAK